MDTYWSDHCRHTTFSTRLGEVKILSDNPEIHNAWEQYKKLFELDGVSLEFDRDALEAIVDKALERKTGARGLRAIMEAVTLDLMYHIPSDESITKCEITKEDVEKNLAIEEKEEKALVEKLEQAS